MSQTVGGRLKQLSGLSGATVGTMLLAIGSGATMAACLANYSGLASGTVAEHLLTDVAPQASASTGGSWVDAPRRRKTENDEVLLLFLM